MTDLTIGATPRIRRSPFYEATLRYGASQFTVYNHMLLPTAYAGQLAEYEALVRAVTIWDVGAERQVEIIGTDAAGLTQRIVTRDVAKIRPGHARYGFVCNEAGGVLNDPVILRLDHDHFWLSLADRDILLWVQGIAHAGGFDVVVREPDVSPLQVQGPRSRDLIGDVFGDEIRDLGYFRFRQVDLDGVPLLVSRTGWSGEFGYEVFLRDGSRGDWLWERLFTAGEPYGVQPAAPNQIRRLEAGILSYGTDMDDSVTPLELGMARLVDLEGDDFVGRDALRLQRDQGVARLLVGIRFDGIPVRGTGVRRPATVDGHPAGHVSSVTYSPRVGENIGLALLAIGAAAPGSEVTLHLDDGDRRATVVALPFVESLRST